MTKALSITPALLDREKLNLSLMPCSIFEKICTLEICSNDFVKYLAKVTKLIKRKSVNRANGR